MKDFYSVYRNITLINNVVVREIVRERLVMVSFNDYELKLKKNYWEFENIFYWFIFDFLGRIDEKK